MTRIATRVLTEAEVSAILAALRHWQWSGQCEPAARSWELDAIATNEGRVEPLTADQVDELAEAINSANAVRLDAVEV